MTTVASQESQVRARAASQRAQVLADRLEQGARALIDLAASCTDAEWQTPIPHDGRKIGVVVHHVGNMYPLEMQVAQLVASGTPVVGLTMANVDEINAGHAKDQDAVTKGAAIEFVRRNSAAARGGDSHAHRRGARLCRAELVLPGRAADLPVLAGRSPGAAQLSSRGEDSSRVEAVVR